MAIRVVKRSYVREPKVQLSIRIGADLAKKARVYAVTNDVRVQDIVETGIRAVLGEKVAA